MNDHISDSSISTDVSISTGATASFDRLYEAVENDDVPTIRLLVDAGADVSSVDSTGLTLLYGVRSASAARIILETDPNLASVTSFAGISPLDYLYGKHEVHDIRFDLVPVALVLLEYGCQVVGLHSVSCRSALSIAAGEGHFSVVEAILNKQPSLIGTKADSGITVLHDAATPNRGAARCVEYLVGLGCDVNAVDNEGRNALFYACGKAWTPVPESEIEAVTRYLLNVGVTTSNRSSNGETALLAALEWKHEPAALVLIDDGIDISAANDQDETALHIAARNGYLKVVERLLDQGADISARTRIGETVLHLVAYRGVEKHRSIDGYARMMACILLGYCDISVHEVVGQTALEPVSKTGHMEILRRCCTLGVDPSVRNKRGATAFDFVKRADTLMAWDSLEEALQDSKGKEQLRSLILGLTEEADDVVTYAGGLFEEN